MRLSVGVAASLDAVCWALRPKPGHAGPLTGGPGGPGGGGFGGGLPPPSPPPHATRLAAMRTAAGSRERRCSVTRCIGTGYYRPPTAFGRESAANRSSGAEYRVGQQELDRVGARLVDGLVGKRGEHLVHALPRARLELRMREYVEIVALDATHHA